MPVIEYTEQLETCVCWCGIHLAVPRNLYRQAHDLGSTSIYCPLGHEFSFPESELDRERKRREQAEREAKWAGDRRQAEQELREHTERQLASQKAATTRARKRAAAAVCPCCKRSFVQLRRHMATKHPDYDPERG